jgi:cell wall-associated NlpC family hydrolase
MSSLSVGARLRATVVTVAMSAGLLGAGAFVSAPAATAMTASQVHAQKAQEVLHWSSLQKGKPYHYGSAGPSRFDCSGLVQYVFRNAISKSLPRTAAAQYSASHHISKTYLHLGDLVFVRSGGGISHVGIYAGNGYWWVAPHTGTVVQKQKIYTSNVVYGSFIH